MPIQTPYYNLHQIITGVYTEGNEFVFADGTDYIGMYYVIPTGQRFSGPRPENNSRELFVKRISQTNDSLVYNRINETVIPNYRSPISMEVFPTEYDYNRGFMQRFFLQKRNSPLNSIIEINSEQYNSVNTTNRPGINGVIWNKLRINWKISKIPRADASYINQLTLTQVENSFPHIGKYVTDLLEFYR